MSPVRVIPPEAMARAKYAVTRAQVRDEIHAEFMAVAELEANRFAPWSDVSAALRRLADRIDQSDEQLARLAMTP